MTRHVITLPLAGENAVAKAALPREEAKPNEEPIMHYVCFVEPSIDRGLEQIPKGPNPRYVNVDGKIPKEIEKSFVEESVYKPNSPYSATKASSDLLVRAWWKTYKLPLIVTNCSNNYGPWQHPEKLIPTIICNAISDKKIPIYGEGTNLRDWLHVDDHVRALLAVSEKTLKFNRYNIGANQEIPNVDLANMICELLDSKLKRDSSKF